MNLISCDNCGVVLDKNKVRFAPSSEKLLDDGSVNEDKFTWSHDDYIAFVECPVCKEKITKDQK